MSANCTDPNYTWTFNSLSQSTCLVAAYLATACDGGPPVVGPQLPPTWHYFGPTAALASPCRCNTVYYTLLNACGVCGGGLEYLTWSQWTPNCTAVYTTFPESIPPGTRVPHWAYLPIGADDLWNIAAARAAATSGPESTGTASGPTTLTGLVSTATSTTTSGPITTVYPSGNTGGEGTQNSKSTNVGAIAGGVVGGVIGLALVGLLGIFLFRRRNSDRVAPPSLVSTSQYPSPMPLVQEKPNLGHNHTGSTMVASFPAPPLAPMRLYDPSDPTTFPAPMNAGIINGSDPILRPLTNGTHGGAPVAQAGYHGGPEV